MPLDWPRISDLPAEERLAFEEWLGGKTRPWLEGVMPAEQDGYYSHDYKAWKRGEEAEGPDAPGPGTMRTVFPDGTVIRCRRFGHPRREQEGDE